MSNYKVIRKLDYNKSQNNPFLHVKEYLFADRKGKKILLLKLINLYSQNLTSFKLKVHQFDKNDNLIKISNFEYKNFIAVCNQIFVPYTNLDLDNKCEDVIIEVLNAQFDGFYYDINNFSKRQEKEKVFKEEITEEIINEGEVKNDFFVEKRVVKIPKAIYPLFACLLLGASIVSGILVDQYKKNHYEFSLDDFTYEIIGGNSEDYEFDETSDIILTSFKGKAKKIEIPEYILNHRIVGVGEKAFHKNAVLEELVISSSNDFVIGDSAFKDCLKLKKVSFGGTTEIGNNAFNGCSNLKTFESATIESIGSYAFQLSGLESIYISGETDNLIFGTGVFSNISNLKKVEIQRPWTMNEYASSYSIFNDCENISSVNFNTNVVNGISLSIYDLFDCNTSELKSVYIENMTTIPDRFVENCSSLQTVIINNIENSSIIGNGAFDNCSSLINYNFDYSNVSIIGDYAFRNTLMSEFNFNNIISLGEYSFSNTKISKVEILNPKFTGLKNGVFSECSNLESVSILSPISSIPESAFKGTLITTLNLSEDSVINSVGAYSFAGCVNFDSFELFESITNVGQYAFSDCEKLEEFNINSSITSIPNGLFSDCKNLKGITFESIESLTTIGDSAFEGCSAISSIDLQGAIALSSIGTRAFKNCTSLTSINYSSSTLITKIEDFTFSGCESLFSFNLPYSIQIIGEGAFSNCDSLVEVILTDNITEIREGAFSNCETLTKVYIPPSVITLSKDILKSCDSLQSVTLPFLGYDMLSDLSFNYIFGSHDANNLNELVINSSVSIDSNSFRNVSNLNKLIFEKDVFSIDDYAFSGSGISEIQFLGNIGNMGYGIFNSNSKLKRLTIPKLYTSNSIFDSYGANNLEELTLTDVEIVTQGDFMSFQNLKKIEFKDKTKEIGEYAFSYLNNLEECIIPNSVIKIGNYILQGCTSLKKLTIPYIGNNINSYNNISNIIGWNEDSKLEEISITNASNLNSYAMSNLPSLKIVNLNDNITQIPTGCFENCYKLETVNLPQNLTSITYNSFYNCFNLKNLVLPSSLTYLDNMAFTNCYSLISIKNNSQLNLNPNYVSNYLIEVLTGEQESTIPTYKQDGFTFVKGKNGWILFDYDGDSEAFNVPASFTYNEEEVNSYEIKCALLFDNDTIKSVQVPSFVSSIGDYTFYSCDNLTEVNFSESSNLKNICSFAFSKCNSLPKIVIPESTIEIRNNAFSYCESLKSVTLPSTLTNIDYDAFFYCEKLYEVYNLSSLPIELKSSDYGRIAEHALVIHSSLEEDNLKFYSDNKFVYIYFGDQCYIESYLNKDHDYLALPSSIVIDDYTFNKYSILDRAFEYSSFETLIIPDAVEKIGDFAFNNCYNLRNLSFGVNSQLKSIGNSAFGGCYLLKEANLPNSIEELGNNAFEHCNELEKVNIPTSLTNIKVNTFYSCKNLLSVTIPENIDFIDYGAFYDCNSLYEVFNLSSLNIIKGSSDHGFVAKNALVVHTSLDSKPIEKVNIDNITYLLIGDTAYILKAIDNFVMNVSLPEIITYSGKDYNEIIILNNAFSNCYNLQSIHISAAVTEIHDGAFNGCSNLGSITFAPSSKITVINPYTFSYCSSLKEIILPETIELIGHSAFNYCESLVSIILPSKLKNIDFNAFYHCISLVRVVNLSSLFLEEGSSNYGEIAKYAFEILKAVPTNTKVDRMNYDGFNFVNLNNQWILNYSFNGMTNYIKLPESIYTHDGKNINNYVLGPKAINLYNNGIVIMPLAVTEIKEDSLYNVSQLIILYEGTIEQWEKVIKPTNLNATIYYKNDCLHDENSWCYNYSYIPIYGNSYVKEWTILTESTCSSNGRKSGECSNCNKLVYVDIPKTDHNFVDGVCSHCSYQKIIVNKDNLNQLFVQSNANKPFSYNNYNVLINNKINDKEETSISRTAKKAEKIVFNVQVSTEKSHDKFYLYIDDKLIYSSSGETCEYSISVDLLNGETIKLVYKKDDSVSSGNDAVYIKNLTIFY